MTVKELRERLAQLPDDLIVIVVLDDETFGDVYNIKDPNDDIHIVIEGQRPL